MKNFIIPFKNRLIAGLTILILAASGCSLEEESYSIYTPENFYSNEQEVLAAMSGIYRNFAAIATMGAQYRVFELCTDQVVVHGKIQGWWAGDNFEQLAEHKWDTDHAWISSTYNFYFSIVG
ncbi:MAG: hypothetical protein KDC44_17540, partial [Phaeodactylibacter sp.]|nr:hypothetical protein [Phaeodactylibacter sp.]